MAKRVTEKDIEEMNEAYLICKSYSGVAAATGWSASTVRKYIVEGYTSKNKHTLTKEFVIEPVEETAKRLSSQSNLSMLTPEEKAALKKLQKRMLV